jgi:hypothetical protein
MRASIHLPRGERFYTDALEGLTRVNETLYREKRLPSIYAGGVRYEIEKSEEWRNAEEVLADGWGDCEDLAAARAGELRAGGEQGASVVVKRTGPKMTHALVRRANGAIEDPSKRLGMGKEQIGGAMSSRYPGYDSVGASFLSRLVRPTAKKPPRVVQVGPVKPAASPGLTVATAMLPQAVTAPAATSPYERDYSPLAPAADEREPYELSDTGTDDYGDEDSSSPWAVTDEDWEQIGADTSDSAELTWSVDRTPTGWRGVVRVPLSAGKALFVARQGDTKPAAAKAALSAATGVLDSPLAKTLIPPQALAALNVLRSPTAQKAAKVAFDVAKKLKFW